MTAKRSVLLNISAPRLLVAMRRSAEMPSPTTA